MEIKWIEDFLALARCQSFSKAAEARHVTQSGFSRRIQSLEQWVGAELVARNSYPASLTPAGKLFRETAEELLRTLYDTRAIIRKQQRIPGIALQIAAGHTIALNFLPDWLHALSARYGEMPARIVPSNVHDAVVMLVNGGCELMPSYHHPELSLHLDPARYAFMTIGHDVLLPVSVPGPKGGPIFRLPGTEAKPVPFLRYSESAFFGRCMELLLTRAAMTHVLHPAYESDMAELLKKMALQKRGLAWLPKSSIQQELDRGELVPAGAQTWWLDLEIRLYRDRGNKNPALERLWDFLAAGEPEMMG